MSAAKNIYTVRHKTLAPRLVKHFSRARAEAFVARDTISAALSTQDELIELRDAGVQVEDGTVEPVVE